MIVNAPKREKIEHERKDNGLDKCKQTRMHRYASECACERAPLCVCVWISAMCIINARRCFPYRLCECVRGEETRHRRDQSGANIEIHTAAPHQVYSNRHFLLSDTATHTILSKYHRILLLFIFWILFVVVVHFSLCLMFPGSWLSRLLFCSRRLLLHSHSVICVCISRMMFDIRSVVLCVCACVSVYK